MATQHPRTAELALRMHSTSVLQLAGALDRRAGSAIRAHARFGGSTIPAHVRELVLCAEAAELEAIALGREADQLR